MSNVSILEERNSSTLVNKSLDLGKEIENKKRWRIEKRMGRESTEKYIRKEMKKYLILISILIWILCIYKIIKINKFL